jgi:nucleoside-diphosphate-sugar epimerase
MSNTLDHTDDPGAHHALVFGASGIIGWSCVHQLLSNYPAPGSFGRVTAVTNRPVTLEESCWAAAPDSDAARLPGRPRLQLVSGIDLRGSDGNGSDERRHRAFADTLRDNIEDVAGVTHVYYFGKSKLLSMRPPH